MLKRFTFNDVRYAAKECERQRSGEMSVYHMLNALETMRQQKKPWYKQPSDDGFIAFVVELAKYVNNNAGLSVRDVPVTVNGNVLKVTGEALWDSLRRFLENSNYMTPVEFYKEFESIHPFIDGNGRVGSILYNWLNGTLDSPVAPPDVFEESC